MFLSLKINESISPCEDKKQNIMSKKWLLNLTENKETTGDFDESWCARETEMKNVIGVNSRIKRRKVKWAIRDNY